MSVVRSLGVIVLLLALVACDDEGDGDGGLDGGMDTFDAGEPSDDAGPIPEGATRFVLRIENLAPPTFPTALGAGVALAHADPDPLFTEGARDRGLGLEALAEDADPRVLADALEARRFASIGPGQMREIVVDALPSTPRASFATMLLESNDVFLAPTGEGIPLFDAEGRPLPARDVTELVHVWNAGTEADQAPGLGPVQGARQEAPGEGSAEGTIRPFEDGTRTLPLARDIARVEVEAEGSRFTITLENVSEQRGLIVTRISPLFWAVHDETVRLFEVGAPAPDNGLESLAEESGIHEISMWAIAASGIRTWGVADQPLGTDRHGVAEPDDRFQLVVEPDGAHPFLSFAAMVVVSNDAFLALPPSGVRLLEEDGTPRAAADVEREILASLTVWDAGTEENEVPGAGLNVSPQPSGPNAGAPDHDPRVRRYDDFINDVGPDSLHSIVPVHIRRLRGTTFEVTITNRSHDTAYPMLITPFAYGLHADDTQMFDPARPATPGMISLAEDCYTNMLHGEIQSDAGFVQSSVAALPVGDAMTGPLRHGHSYVFTVTADREHRRLNMAAMPYPSNDMFLAFDPEGIELLSEMGAPRSDADIAADVRRMFRAWDVGTEANQAGGAGRDAVPLQPAIDLGVSEGDGTVRREPDPVWSYPSASELVRVTIAPVAP